MDSEFQQQEYQHHFRDLQKEFQHQKQRVNNLTRLRSAPSTYFESFLDAADIITNPGGASGGGKGDVSNTKGDFFNARPLSPETENLFSRFMSSMGEGSNSSQKLCEIPENSQMQPYSMAAVKDEQGKYKTPSQMTYQSSSKPPLGNQHSSVGILSTSHMKVALGGHNSNGASSLTRHSSSPAGFFDSLDIDGYGVLRGIDNYGDSNTGKHQVNYSSGQTSTTSGLVRQKSEVEEKIMRMNSLEETKFSNNQNNDGNYRNGVPISLWDDSSLSKSFSSIDGADDGGQFFTEKNSSENQIGQPRSRHPLLAHQLSLPNTSAEFSVMEKLLHFQDDVPLKIRAKRGFATHPRSIAERVRRTKISERMRKLQDLVPNMDKQTNTSDMLDLAVNYIKDLRKQVKTLNGNREKCTCPK
ncbi:hypothetical protein RND81_09G260200 [Saponaria officinalis]|uniref:BHLH domain-containing protein n=1 Tax=Saponaria officinalis TaxID=3572 RepID=A0AAW1IRH5_SAPOF